MTVITKIIEVARADFESFEAEAEHVFSIFTGMFGNPDEHPDLQQFATKLLGDVSGTLTDAAKTIDAGTHTFTRSYVSPDGVHVAVAATATPGASGAARASGDKSFYTVGLVDALSVQTPAPDELDGFDADAASRKESDMARAAMADNSPKDYVG